MQHLTLFNGRHLLSQGYDTTCRRTSAADRWLTNQLTWQITGLSPSKSRELAEKTQSCSHADDGDDALHVYLHNDMRTSDGHLHVFVHQRRTPCLLCSRLTSSSTAVPTSSPALVQK